MSPLWDPQWHAWQKAKPYLADMAQTRPQMPAENLPTSPAKQPHVLREYVLRDREHAQFAFLGGGAAFLGQPLVDFLRTPLTSILLITVNCSSPWSHCPGKDLLKVIGPQAPSLCFLRLRNPGFPLTPRAQLCHCWILGMLVSSGRGGMSTPPKTNRSCIW